MTGKSSSELYHLFHQDSDEFERAALACSICLNATNLEMKNNNNNNILGCVLPLIFQLLQESCQSTNSFIFFHSHAILKRENKDSKRESSKSSKLLFSQWSAWRYVWGRTGEGNNLSHPPHPAKESTSIRPRFPYWLINCSAKYSALHYSSCRQDVSFAAKFQGQMGYRNVIEIKLVCCAAGAGRSESCLLNTQCADNWHHPPLKKKKHQWWRLISFWSAAKELMS